MNRRPSREVGTEVGAVVVGGDYQGLEIVRRVLAIQEA